MFLRKGWILAISDAPGMTGEHLGDVWMPTNNASAVLSRMKGLEMLRSIHSGMLFVLYG